MKGCQVEAKGSGAMRVCVCAGACVCVCEDITLIAPEKRLLHRQQGDVMHD